MSLAVVFGFEEVGEVRYLALATEEAEDKCSSEAADLVAAQQLVELQVAAVQAYFESEPAVVP